MLKITLSVNVGTVSYATSGSNVYKVTVKGSELPLPLPAIPLGIPNSVTTNTICNTRYTIGDTVLVAYPEAYGNDSTLTYYAVILGPVPDNRDNYADVEDTNKSVKNNTPLDIEIQRLLGSLVSDTDKRSIDFMDFSIDNPVNNLQLPGDTVFAGQDSSIQIGERLVRLAAGTSGMSVDAWTALLRRWGVFYSDDFTGMSSRNVLLNEFIQHEEVRKSNLSGVYPELKKQYGPLTRGYAQVLEGEIPLSCIAQTEDGKLQLSAVSGVRLSKTLAIPSTQLTTQETVNGVDKLTEALKNIDKPINLDGICVTEVGKDSDQLLNPCTLSEAESMNSSSMELVGIFSGLLEKLVKVSSIIDTCDDGSIVIRDAWGSEIRMIAGDIHITAARNIVTQAADTVLASSGVLSLSGDSGLQAGSTAGDILIQAGDELDLIGHNRTTLSSEGTVTTCAKAVETTAESAVLKTTGTVDVRASDIVAESAKSIALCGNNSVAVGTTTSGIILDGRCVKLCGPYTAVESELWVIPAQNNSIKIDNKSYIVKSSNASRPGITVTAGALAVAGDISTNSRVMAKGDLATAGKVRAGDVKDKVGVYKDGSVTIGSFRIPDGVRQFGYAVSRSAQLMYSTVSQIYDKIRDAVAALLINKTIFKLSNRLPSKRTDNVAQSSSRVYIYPGKKFWESGEATSDGVHKK